MSRVFFLTVDDEHTGFHIGYHRCGAYHQSLDTNHFIHVYLRISKGIQRDHLLLKPCTVWVQLSHVH